MSFAQFLLSAAKHTSRTSACPQTACAGTSMLRLATRVLSRIAPRHDLPQERQLARKRRVHAGAYEAQGGTCLSSARIEQEAHSPRPVRESRSLTHSSITSHNRDKRFFAIAPPKQDSAQRSRGRCAAARQTWPKPKRGTHAKCGSSAAFGHLCLQAGRRLYQGRIDPS